MNSAYGSSELPRQLPLGGHGGRGSMPSLIPPIVSASSASNSASLDHLYHHQPPPRLPLGAVPQSPIQSQAPPPPPPHLHPPSHHFQLHSGHGHHQQPHHERDHRLPPPVASYSTHSHHLQHDPLPQRLDSSQPGHPGAAEHRDHSQHALDEPSRSHDPYPSMAAGALVHSESQQPASASLLLPISNVEEATGRRYHLDVVQQPRRARMCGFGDKDRRPITPPPCVRLIIIDVATGKEIDCNDIDHSMFVLNVDLWNEDGTREVNLVRSSTSSSPSVSSTVTYPYGSITVGESSHTYGQSAPPPSREASYSVSQAASYAPEYQTQPTYTQGSSAYPPNGTYGPPQQYYPQHQGYRAETGPPGALQTAVGGFRGYTQDHNALTKMAVVGGQPQGMFTRNLIGSLAASAFRLTDTSEHLGIWFVLQDLSVRTEGPFRLRFSFVNVGPLAGQNGAKVNTGRAPILASCFSEVFNVYSAKKFPGVCESTPLSKTFAAQGIKIPIRKDANLKGGDGEDDYGD
ncbi:hypothetical protein MKX07_002029 [Trichoderma sp. CBMAI-0711]|uniref:Velvet domain-containing protein n=1 Tax=Trichoderma parareesei TaxID=858221 RepID=A0A2H2ZVA5_TRIPA|nr:hypothetical protein MKX07_002029 [Trichoderma sp. CBMAI-0711]OTA04595.1 hypothetical protein A9Z42_0052030 [Trichoderma parareesei]